jgi:thioredoxin reductase (NADPH)
MLDFKLQNTDSKKSDKELLYDVIIVGAGPAGLTAGIYSSRSLLKTLILEEKVVGGEAASTNLIENYPGFPEGIPGVDLTEKMRIQAENFHTKIVLTSVKGIEWTGAKKEVITSDGTFTTKTLILASGTSPKSLNIPGEKEFKGRGVSYCATCDAPFFQDKNVAVIGAGNSGIQEGLYLLKFVKSLTLIEFLPHMTAEKILQERVKKVDKVEVSLNTKLISINGDNTVESVTIENRETKTTSDIPVDGVFIYAGLKPNTAFLKGLVNLDKNGFIETDEHLMTSQKGIFAAGDVRKKELRQVATAIGDGAHASFSAHRYLEQLEM